MYTHVLTLWIKVYQLLRNYTFNETNHNPFGLLLTAVNKLNRCIFFILDYTIVSYTNVNTI